MTDTPPKATAYLMLGCPFSFKFLLFMTEAGLRDQIRVVPVDPEATHYEQLRTELEDATGKKASFPTVEVEPGIYRSETDELIDYFANRHGIDPGDLPTLQFYNDGVFKAMGNLYRENVQLREQLKTDA
jgi:hypothetical protein